MDNTDVIELSSDSNDSVPFVNTNSIKPPALDILDDDYNFPEVPFASEPTAAKKNTNSDLGAVFKSNSDIETELFKKYVSEKSTSKGTKARERKNVSSKNDKELLRMEKCRKAEEAAKIKAEKAAAAARLKSMQPGECMNYMQVILDLGFTNFNFFDSLITELQQYELVYKLKSQIISNSVTWTRSEQKNSNSEHITGENKSVEENHIIVVWDYTETIKKIASDMFLTSIVSIQTSKPGKSITLIIYGMENYFRHHRNLKKMQVKNQCLGRVGDGKKRRGSKAFEDLPVISRKQLELCLTEIQLTLNCNSQLIETPHGLGQVIGQYTKAIAEAPFKIHKKQMLQSQLDWYVAGDNKDTVKVDKDGNGLKRLWQQQLCQFNLARLETAEAIISKYPTPSHLMDAYTRCTPSEDQKNCRAYHKCPKDRT
ncbi:crossover junction endonuclease EME1 isoform X2 [Diprion similis]|uniref:crossover junction endonuclease EME1 isoform X2 n=1 Tax=Diprion similis TaxID=362088 RepID=UPI001EF9480D|nr:crossover junction endonuclease EME1 isoform X2 [Diprion similis]